MRNLQKPSADKRPIAFMSIEDVSKLPNKEAIVALADYDGPIRSLLERIISTHADDAHVLMDLWRKEAKGIMNVIYKLNGLKQRWTEV